MYLCYNILLIQNNLKGEYPCKTQPKNIQKKMRQLTPIPCFHTRFSRRYEVVEMRDMLGISHDGFWYGDLLEYIVKGIENLRKKWTKTSR